jgi:hypothetical protein
MQQYIETIGQLRYPNHGLNGILNKISIIAIYSFFVMFPFNFLLIDIFSFYREAYTFLFIMIILNYIFINRVNFLILPNNFIIIILLYWVIYMGFCYMFDTETSLYPDEDLTTVIQQITIYGRSNYLIRNLFVFLPIAPLIFIRRLTTREFNTLLLLICVVCPISVISFYQSQGFTSIAHAVIKLTVTGRGLTAYNDFIPYITFPFISGIFLFFRFKNYFLRFVLLTLIIFDFIIIIFSTSRQSLMFCLLAMFTYAYVRGRKIIPFVLIVSIAGYYLISSFGELQSRFLTGQIAESPRGEIILTGLSMVGGVKEWLIGNGLSSVLYSGPHTNYVRFLQRIGMIGMCLTYLPFFYIFFKLLGDIWHFKNDPWFDLDLAWFLLMAIAFTLFHSCFGYPHEEVWSGPFVWLALGLGLPLGAKKRGLQISGARLAPSDSISPDQPLRAPEAAPMI